MGLDSGYGIGSLKPGVCTSSTRPAAPFEGQTIYETDTDVLAIYNGTSWVTIGPSAPTWTSYTPAIKGGGTTVTATLAYAKYCQIGKLVFVQVRATATSSGIAGAWSVDFPAGLTPLVSSSTRPIGNFVCFQASTFYHGYCFAGSFFAGISNGSNDYMGQASPAITLQSGSIVALEATYEVA